MGLSENSVPLHPMVLLIIIPTKWLFHWGYSPFSDIPISHVEFHSSASSAAPGSHCIFTIFIEAVVVLDTGTQQQDVGQNGRPLMGPSDVNV